MKPFFNNEKEAGWLRGWFHAIVAEFEGHDGWTISGMAVGISGWIMTFAVFFLAKNSPPDKELHFILESGYGILLYTIPFLIATGIPLMGKLMQHAAEYVTQQLSPIKQDWYKWSVGKKYYDGEIWVAVFSFSALVATGVLLVFLLPSILIVLGVIGAIIAAYFGFLRTARQAYSLKTRFEQHKRDPNAHQNNDSQ